MVVLEAMACGIPVLGTASGGVAELVDDEVGMLVAPNDADALAEGIAAIYRRDLRALGKSARRRMVAHYDWNVVMPQLVRHYAALTGGVQAAHAVEESKYAIE
jgi:alpha-1,6-mannosyltransferase